MDTTERLQAIKRVDALRAAEWKVTLPDGHVVTLRDPEKVTEGQRTAFKSAGIMAKLLEDKVNEAMTLGNEPMVAMLLGRQADAIAQMDHKCIAMFVDSWDYAEAVPTIQNPEPLKAMPGPVFDTLYQHAKDLVERVFLNPEPTPMDVDSPFPASNGLSQTS